MLEGTVRQLLRRGRGLVLWLTGAGISAESGIPTFRGEEGYWRVGSRNYQPEELATWRAFQQMSDEGFNIITLNILGLYPALRTTASDERKINTFLLS